VFGTVREWHDEEGWGVVLGDDFADPIWVHFSAIVAMAPYRELAAGQRVEVEIVGPLDQDGFRYRAESARAV
jgi:CspA family cold shock protein